MERDFLISLIVSGFITILYFFDIIALPQVDTDTLLIIYITLIGISLGTLAIYNGFGRNIKRAYQKKIFPFLKRIFYTPVIISMIGIFTTVITPTVFGELILFNFFLLAYALLSTFEIFDFSFRLISAQAIKFKLK